VSLTLGGLAAGGFVSPALGGLAAGGFVSPATGSLGVGCPAAVVAAGLAEALGVGSAPQPHSAAALATRLKN
jgi:hypothetical protein